MNPSPSAPAASYASSGTTSHIGLGGTHDGHRAQAPRPIAGVIASSIWPDGLGACSKERPSSRCANSSATTRKRSAGDAASSSRRAKTIRSTTKRSGSCRASRCAAAAGSAGRSCPEAFARRAAAGRIQIDGAIPRRSLRVHAPSVARLPVTFAPALGSPWTVLGRAPRRTASGSPAASASSGAASSRTTASEASQARSSSPRRPPRLRGLKPGRAQRKAGA
jgi:hypothetical protein